MWHHFSHWRHFKPVIKTQENKTVLVLADKCRVESRFSYWKADEKIFLGPLNILMFMYMWEHFNSHFLWPSFLVILFTLEASARFTSSSCLSGMPRFASQPSPATVHLGNSMVMACEVNSDLVAFTRWEKDRQPLEPSTRLVQLPSGALVISNASEADAGLYRCLVENVGSSKTSDEAQLQIVPGNLRK